MQNCHVEFNFFFSQTLQPSSRITISGTKSVGKSMAKSLKDGRYSVNMDHGSEILNSLKI